MTEHRFWRRCGETCLALFAFGLIFVAPTLANGGTHTCYCSGWTWDNIFVEESLDCPNSIPGCSCMWLYDNDTPPRKIGVKAFCGGHP
jgi:hypothetical protein